MVLISTMMLMAMALETTTPAMDRLRRGRATLPSIVKTIADLPSFVAWKSVATHWSHCAFNRAAVHRGSFVILAVDHLDRGKGINAWPKPDAGCANGTSHTDRACSSHAGPRYEPDGFHASPICWMRLVDRPAV